MESARALTIAVLAGGAASRLGGRDKGLEPLHGRALIEWVIEAIAAMTTRSGMFAPKILIVANRHHEVYARHGETIADDICGFRGPLAGIASALRFAKTPWLLTLPVDCPEPPAELAARLLSGARETAGAGVCVHDGERRQPLFALYRRELAHSASLALEAGQGVSQWQTSVGVQTLDFADARGQFGNLNTREDFADYARSRQTS